MLRSVAKHAAKANRLSQTRYIQTTSTLKNAQADPQISKIVDQIATLNLLQASELVSALKVPKN
jgi:hypothetical protein